MPKKLKGRLTISRNRGGPVDENGSVSIVVEDVASCLRLFDVRIDPRDFAEAIFGSARTPCRIDFFKSAARTVGKKLEIRHVTVETSDGEFPSDAELADHEVDGWVADREKFNHHNYRVAEGRSFYLVSLRRYVKKPKRGSS